MKKIFLLLFLAVIPFASISAQRSQQANQNSSKDWAQFYRYSKSNSETIASELYPKAVFIGDSITDLWDQMDHEFFAANNFAGRGISGQTTSQMLVRFRDDVIDLKPKYVVILAGINDIAMNNGFIAKEHIIGNIISMCELAKLHKIKPIICSILPAIEISWRMELGNPTSDIVAINDALKEYAKKNGIKYVDYFSKMKDKSQGLRKEYCKTNKMGELDRLHPSLEGYKTMEGIILKYVK